MSNDNPSTGTADYSFKVGRHTVKINFVGSSSRGRNIGDYNDIGVSFSVNGSYSANSNMTKAEQDASSAKLSKIFQHHISRQQKQAIFRCSAATNDGRGAHRAYAYKTMGFSRPVGGTIGSQQVAFVRNGKVDPVKTQKALEIREGNNATFTAQADQRWAQAVQAYQQQRNAARAQRRAAAQAQRTTAA